MREMSELANIVYGYDLEAKEINHKFESFYDIVAITAMEESIYEYVSEDDSESIVMESAVGKLIKKTVETIGEIIKSLCNFIADLVDKVISKVTGKDVQDKLDSLKNVESDEKINILDSDREVERLNTYIREMAILERKLLNLKRSNRFLKLSSRQSNAMIIECNQILNEMNKLNDRYDNEFLDDNSDVIKVALADAVRFNEKSLKNVKVDFKEVEEGAKKVLKEFEQDANGCDVPVKLNILQKMSNSIATRARKCTQHMCKYRLINLRAVMMVGIGTGAVIGTKAYLKTPKGQQKMAELVTKAQTKANEYASKIK